MYDDHWKLISEIQNHSCDTLLKIFNCKFKFYKLPEPANGVLSLQMVGDVMLCFYNSTQQASVTGVPLCFIDHSVQGVSVGK